MTEVRAQVNEETNKGQFLGRADLIGSVYLKPVAAPAAGAAASPALAAVAAYLPALRMWSSRFSRSVKESEQGRKS